MFHEQQVQQWCSSINQLHTRVRCKRHHAAHAAGPSRVAFRGRSAACLPFAVDSPLAFPEDGFSCMRKKRRGRMDKS